MRSPRNIRNMSVIAHVDHGKSTLSDSLVSKAGIISQERAGDQCVMDTREDEKERGITIKSTAISLYFKASSDDVPYIKEKPETDDAGNVHFLINLIDSPGHVDFSAEVSAALRTTDGALVVVDAIEGVSCQTETVLRQALQESIVPVLIINKVDRAMLELGMDKEDLYQTFCRIIESVNVVIDTYQSKNLAVEPLDPTKLNVAFGSGKQQWAFTLMDVAKIYSKKLGIPVDKLVTKFWGDNYWNPNTKKWTTNGVDESGKKLERAFCAFVLEPIYKIYSIHKNGAKREDYENVTSKLNIHMAAKDWEKNQPKDILKVVMQKFLPAADAILLMMAIHLPSPAKAQTYRCATLYEGPQDDEVAEAVKKCDPNGPLLLYVSKMVPSTDGARFYAFGRVFSGTVQAGQMVRIQGPEYVPGKTKDLYNKTVQRTVLMMAGKVEPIDNVPAGNIVGLVGVDQFIMKTATLTTSPIAYNIRSMKFSVSPVVQIAIRPKDPQDLPKLVEGMKRLCKSDPCVQTIQTESGEFVVCGAGELHLEICLKDLEKDLAKIPIVQSNPVVPYRETVQGLSSMVALAKSPNKHNRLYITVEPLDEDLSKAIEEGECTGDMDAKTRSRYLAEKHGWDLTETKKIWAFGPTEKTPNIIIDSTKGVQYVHEIRDHVVAGFIWTAQKGVLCEEQMRGCKVNILDATLHADAIHRGGGQIIPTTRRAIYAACMLAKPTLMEPVYLAEIVAPDTAMGGIYNVLNKRRGKILSDEIKFGTPLHVIQAHLPVADSFGFTKDLRAATQGQAFPTCMFDHWAVMEGDASDPSGRIYQTVMEIRKRKNLKMEMPTYLDYYDKL